MLSQRLALLVLQQNSGVSNKAKLKQTIAETQAAFEKSHYALKNGDMDSGIEASFTPDLLAAYEEIEIDLNLLLGLVEKSLSEDGLKARQSQRLLEVSQSFLEKMDRIVLQSEVFVKRQVWRLQVLEFSLFVIFLVIVFLEIRYVIFPGQKILVKQNQALQEQRMLAFHKSRLAEVGELGAGVAHEINNPLAIISSHLDSLKLGLENESISKERIGKFIDVTQRMLVRIEAITSILLSLGRSNSQVKSLIDLKKTIEEDVLLFRNVIAANNVNVEIVRDSDKPLKVKINEGYLHQVIINLLKNAIEALRLQETKQILFKISETPEGRVVLSVEDNGPGVPREIQDKIFLPFFSTKQEVSGGAGIGLGVLQKIIAESGGTIELDKTFDAGARFLVILPAPPSDSV